MNKNYTQEDGHDFLEKLDILKDTLGTEDENHRKLCIEKITKGMAMKSGDEKKAETFFQSAMCFTENFFKKHQTT